jgi:dUTP pyrophosphatase
MEFLSNTDNFDYLKIYINNEELKNKYIDHIEKHNTTSQGQYPNAGFDLLNPEKLLTCTKIIKVDTQIVCAMYDYRNKPLNYNLFARSSIVKTNLRLANSVGVIDSGYRGHIIGVLDNIDQSVSSLIGGIIDKYTRLLQLCSPTLKPLYVMLVDSLDDLGITDRGTCGFGSTGI